MGLVIGLSIAALTLAALSRTRALSRAGMQLAGAAMLFGLGGYALQGRAGLPGSPASERARAALPPVIPLEMAGEFYGRFNSAYPWLVIANGYSERGESADAVAILQSALKARPGDSELWVALGNALISHGGGRMSGAAELAFARAMSAAPRHPGPPFFYGLALLKQGHPRETVALWRQAATRGPPNASWQGSLATRTALVERLLEREAETGSR